MIGKLIIARHQESVWNKLGKWTGSRDIHLTDEGFHASEDVGLLIKDIQVDCAFASMEVRSIETLTCILNTCLEFKVPTEHSAALNERDYGDYTGKNKFEMEKLLGEEEFKKLRRSWDYPIPNGESLKIVYDRVVPFFLAKVLPVLNNGKNVLIVAHGNSLRALVKYIENISDTDIAEVEVPFESIILYNVDAEGHVVKKEIRKKEETKNIHGPSAQIIATIGPASASEEVLGHMIQQGLDVARLNFSWGEVDLKKESIELIRRLAHKNNRKVSIIADLPGPRIQHTHGHTFDHTTTSSITEKDKEFIEFAADKNLEYIALSFVGRAEDVIECRNIIQEFKGTQKIIAKIERKEAIDHLEEIVSEADAVMVARGDLGTELPIEQVPFIQQEIIKLAKLHGKPVIVATQMLFSMVHSDVPTRAEVTDVEIAITEGADAVMLSEETATGEYPIESVEVMKKLITEAEKHIDMERQVNAL